MQQQSCGQLQQGSSHFPLDASGAPLPYMGQGSGDPLGCGMSDGGGMGDDQGAMHPVDQAFCRPMGSSQQQQHFLSDAASQVCPELAPCFVWSLLTLFRMMIGL